MIITRDLLPMSGQLTLYNDIFLRNDLTADQIMKDVNKYVTARHIPISNNPIEMIKLSGRLAREIHELNESIGEIRTVRSGWISYLIEEKYRRRGYATEALKACRDVSLSAGVEPFLNIDDDNEPSKRVAINCGFECEYTHIGKTKTVGIWKYKMPNNKNSLM